jgi:hypothetical protein
VVFGENERQAIDQLLLNPLQINGRNRDKAAVINVRFKLDKARTPTSASA